MVKNWKIFLTSLLIKLAGKRWGKNVDIRCFNNDPSIKSSLKFLRRTPWARTKVEEMYINIFHGFSWGDYSDK